MNYYFPANQLVFLFPADSNRQLTQICVPFYLKSAGTSFSRGLAQKNTADLRFFFPKNLREKLF
jgi:hypothetical protein